MVVPFQPSQPMAKVVAAGLFLLFVLALASACSSDDSAVSAAADPPNDDAAAGPAPTATGTAAPLPTATKTPTATAVPSPTKVPDEPTSVPVTPTPVYVESPFCGFMARTYFWEPDTDSEFLELVPGNVPTSVIRPFRAREILGGPGLGDPKENSQATMILFTMFASDLGRYLNQECPGADWVDTAVTYSGDADFEPVPDPMLPASALDLCANLSDLKTQFDVERGRRGPVSTATALAAQAFAASIDPDAPFDVLAFSHLLLTQVTLSRNWIGFDLYLDIAFDENDIFDTESIAQYFDEACPEVSDTRQWLTPPRAADAFIRPRQGEGLPEGWETVPPEDVSGPFTGDLRTLPVGELTFLATAYPDFESNGIEFSAMPPGWITESLEPPQARLNLTLFYSASELPVEITRFGFKAPNGTEFRADATASYVQPEVVQLVFELSEIPENLNDWQFGLFAE